MEEEMQMTIETYTQLLQTQPEDVTNAKREIVSMQRQLEAAERER
jgi:hypothetical protein